MKSKFVPLALVWLSLLAALPSVGSGLMAKELLHKNASQAEYQSINSVQAISTAAYDQEQSGIVNKIQYNSLRQVLVGVTQLKQGFVGKVNERFAGSKDWKWIVQEGELPDEVNASTVHAKDSVVTTIDSVKMRAATKLSVARTLIHEMMHAYLTLYYYADPLNATKDFPLILSLWSSSAEPDYNAIQHLQMEVGLVDSIALALQEFAEGIGISADASIYKDLAWGGLDFQSNEDLSGVDKKRIQQRLTVEQLASSIASVKPTGPRLG